MVVAPASRSLDPKSRLVGDGDSALWVPTPLRATLTPGESESIVISADFAPGELGSKVARTSQCPPGARLVPATQSVPRWSDGWLNWPALGPPRVTAVMCTVCD